MDISHKNEYHATLHRPQEPKQGRIPKSHLKAGNKIVVSERWRFYSLRQDKACIKCYVGYIRDKYKKMVTFLVFGLVEDSSLLN